MDGQLAVLTWALGLIAGLGIPTLIATLINLQRKMAKILVALPTLQKKEACVELHDRLVRDQLKPVAHELRATRRQVVRLGRALLPLPQAELLALDDGTRDDDDASGG